MKNNESEEMYLETILLLKQKDNNVRSVDVVNELDYAKSSVSRAVNLLKDKGYIYFDDNGIIEFTLKGFAKANDVYEKHKILTEMFVKMGAERESAENNACRIEHVVSDDIVEVVKTYLGNPI